MGGGEQPGSEQTPAEIRQLAERFRALFSTTAVGVIEVSSGGTFLAVNDMYCQMTGYSRDELRGMRVVDLSFPEDREGHGASLDRFLQGESPIYRMEKRYRRKDGHTVWVDVSGARLYDETQRVVRTVNIVQDVSERKSAEQALRDSHERLQLAKDAAGLGVYDWDIGANSLHWDERVRALWGITADEPVTYETFLSGLHPEDRLSMHAKIEAALRKKGEGRFADEFRIVDRLNGRERWVLSLGCISFSESGPVRLVGVVRDITDRKAAETALREREERFRALVDPFAQAVWESDTEGRTVTDSPSWRAYTGQTLDKILRQGWTEAVHPDDREEAAKTWHEAVRQGTPLNTEFRLRSAKGGWRWTNVRASPLRNPDGSVRKWVGMNVDITDRVEAEQALRRSEARYRALFESMDEGFVLVEVIFDDKRRPVDLAYQAANPAAVRMLRQDYTGRRLSELEPGPGFDPEWLKALGCVADTGTPVRSQHYAENLGLWFECHAFRLTQDETPCVGVVFEDITTRRRAEARERAAATRDAFRVRLSDALRPLTNPIEIQAMAARVLGEHLGVARITYKECEGDEAVVHADYAHGVPSSVGRYHLLEYGTALMEELRAGRPVVVSDIEATQLTSFEREAYKNAFIRAHLTVPLRKRGRLTAFLSAQHPSPRIWSDDDLALVEEVAERTWDAVERARTEQALEEKDARLRAALSAARMGTWHWDLRSDAQIMDESLQRLIGTAGGRTAENLEQFLGDIVPEDRSVVRSALRRCAEQGAAVEVEFRVPVNGGVRWLRDQGEVVRGPDGRPLYATGACVDITDRKAMEEELRGAARRKDEFLAMLSHELRNPLAPIRNSIYILERARPGSEQATRARQIIDRQAQHLTRLIEDLLDVTRISRGKIALQRERVDFNDLARRTAEDHRELFEGNGVELTVVDAGRPLYVDGDPTRLAQMIGNLLGNSAKFTPAGGRTTLIVEADDHGDVLVRVRDNGVGISPDTLEHLFQPFMQADRTMDRSRGGLGLGLALIKGLAELHGGHVAAHSEGLGKGAEFTISIPLQHSTDFVNASAASQKAGGRLRVLVIENNLDAAESLRELLELDGHEVTVAYNGYEGFAEARKSKPDVVLCDIGLPGMDGLAVARALRADPDLRRTRLVAVSGYAQPEDIDTAKEAGFDAHLPKPPTLVALEKALETPSPSPT